MFLLELKLKVSYQSNFVYLFRKKSDDNLWWEIFDPKSSRFYYYNAFNQKTVWQKPENGDVLSLSKLQVFQE